MNRSIISRMRPNENLGWCKPYESDDRRVRFTINEHELSAIRINGVDHYSKFEKHIHEAAMLLAGDDSDYIAGYFASDMDYLLSRCSEVGCTYCPFKHDCDAVTEHIVYCIYVTRMEVTAGDLRKRYIPDVVSSEELFKVYYAKGGDEFARGESSPACVGCYETFDAAHKAAKLIYDVEAKTERMDGFAMPLLTADVVVVESYNADADCPDGEICDTFIHGYKKVYPVELEEAEA